MKLSSKQNSGFTLLELVIVVALSMLIAGFILYSFRSYASYQQYNQATSEVEFNLNQARLEARVAADDSAHGIKFTGGDMILFTGDTYSAVDPNNETVSFDFADVTVELSGGVDEVVFSKLDALPSATGTIIVTGTIYNASTTFSISNSGVIQ